LNVLEHLRPYCSRIATAEVENLATMQAAIFNWPEIFAIFDGKARFDYYRAKGRVCNGGVGATTNYVFLPIVINIYEIGVPESEPSNERNGLTFDPDLCH